MKPTRLPALSLRRRIIANRHRLPPTLRDRAYAVITVACCIAIGAMAAWGFRP